MKASEARALTQAAFTSGQNGYLKNVYETIKEAAPGGMSITIKSPTNEQITLLVMQQLTKDGYTVKRQNGHDPRDNESWDNLSISW